MDKPFKIGDRIVEKNSFSPIAIVTGYTDRGFTYVYEEPWYAHPRLGITYIGGEAYTDIPHNFELYNDREKTSSFLYCTSY